MKLIFVHHGMRDVNKAFDKFDDLSRLGVKNAKIVSNILLGLKEKRNIKAIYSSPFKRCYKTAEIINKKLRLPIYQEIGFNEYKSVDNESWFEFQSRMRKALKSIVDKYSDDESVVCVTSGVNVIVFMQLIFKLQSDESAPFVEVPSCSPLIFEIKKSNFTKK